MNNIWNNLDMIEAWKNDELDTTAKKEFESNLKYSPELAKELEIHNLLIKHIQTYGNARTQSTINKVVANLENEGFFKDAKNGVKPMNQRTTKNTFSIYAMAASFIALMVVSFLIFSPKSSPFERYANANPELEKRRMQEERNGLSTVIIRLDAKGLVGTEIGRKDSLVKALQPYDDYKYNDAKVALLQYLYFYPNDTLATLYLGLSYLQNAEYAKAEHYLSKLTTYENFEFKNTAKWYASMCYAKFGEESDIKIAKRLLKELADDPNSKYKDYAKAYLVYFN